MKPLKTILATALSLCVLAACASKPSKSALETITEKGQLVVATSPDYAPFEMTTLVDGKNQIVGSDMLLAQAIADDLGVELVISPMSFDNVLTSLKSGKADIAISALSYSEERAKSFAFSNNYYQATNAILVKADQAGQFKSLSDLAGKKVAVLKGTIEEGTAKDQLTGSQIISLTLMGEAVKELKAGQVDALVLETPVAEGYLAQNSDLALSQLTLAVSEDNAMAVVLPKGQDQLLEKINATIASVDYGQFLTEARQVME